MRKHRQGSNFPKNPKLLASVGSARAIVAQILGNLIPADVFAFQASGILEKFDPCRCCRIRGCPPPMIHCFEKAASCGSWGGGGREHIYIYMYTVYVYIYIYDNPPPGSIVATYVYVCMYVCMYVGMYVPTFVCMYVCMYVCM